MLSGYCHSTDAAWLNTRFCLRITFWVSGFKRLDFLWWNQIVNTDNIELLANNQVWFASSSEKFPIHGLVYVCCPFGKNLSFNAPFCTLSNQLLFHSGMFVVVWILSLIERSFLSRICVYGCWLLFFIVVIWILDHVLVLYCCFVMILGLRINLELIYPTF